MERRENIVYKKKNLYKEKFGPFLSELVMYVNLEIGFWIKKNFFCKLFLRYLSKLAISDTIAYLLSVIIPLHVYNKKISLVLKVHDELFS